MVQVIERSLITPFNVGLDLKYKQDSINIAFVEPDRKKPLHVFLTRLFEEEFRAQGDEFYIVGSREKFPKAAKMGVNIIDDEVDVERLPWALQGKHEKPRDHKKAVYISTVNKLPEGMSMEDDSISRWMRRVMTKKACHIGIVIEGEASEAELKTGSRAVVSSMEGNTQVVTYDRDIRTFIHSISQRLRLQAGAHMVTKKEGIKVEWPTFEAWRTRQEVEEIAYASRYLAGGSHFRDLNLREDASRLQIEMIMRAIKQAGISEGNLSALVEDFAGRNAVMAMTETGIKKTQIDPAKGQVVAATDLLPDGVRYLILKGLPKGHPSTFLRHPSWKTLVEVAEGLLSAFRRGKTREYFKNLPRGATFVDHPFSVETFENAHAYRFMALREAGKVTSLPEYLQYAVNEHKVSSMIPIIPAGTKVGPNAALHTHETPKNNQTDPLIKVVPIELADEDMERLGFEHTPPCGSAESVIGLLMQLDHSYELYGLPQDDEEIRLANMRGHGQFGWGRKGPKSLADRYVNNVQLESHVRRW